MQFLTEYCLVFYSFYSSICFCDLTFQICLYITYTYYSVSYDKFSPTYMVLMTLFCAIIKIDLFSLLRFSFLIYVQLISRAISPYIHIVVFFFQSMFSGLFCFSVSFYDDSAVISGSN